MIEIPDRLRSSVTSDDGRGWLARLPGLVEASFDRWDLEPAGAPYEGGSCAWVAPVRRSPAETVVLKITWPHPEAASEAVALRWWDGDGAVRLLAHHADDWAMLLEQCRPGTPLRDSRIDHEDALTAGTAALAALWEHGVPADGDDVPRLAASCAEWADVAHERRDRFAAELALVDPGLIRAGLDWLRELPRTADRAVVLHGDANPGNLLAADRAAFLAIDPKPLIGDPAFDPWPLIGQLGVPDGPGERDVRTGALRHNLVGVAERLRLDVARLAAWGVARDVEGGLWAMSQGSVADGLDWIRTAADVADLAGL